MLEMGTTDELAASKVLTYVGATIIALAVLSWSIILPVLGILHVLQWLK